MKQLFPTLAMTLAAGCCQLPYDESLSDDISAAEGAATRSSAYPGHFIACRADSQDVAERQRVDNIIRAIREARQNNDVDVVLYFHGGLSSQKYMTEKLGKNLLEKVFLTTAVEKKLYPVFVNYDAGVLDDLFKQQQSLPQDLPAFAALTDTLAAALNSRQSLSSDAYPLTTDKTSAGALQIIYRASGAKQAWLAPSQQGPDEAQVRYLLSLLEAETLPAEFAPPAEKAVAGSALDDIALAMQKVVADEQLRKGNQEALDIGNLFPLTEARLRALRVLARLALRNDHGLVATLQEELLDYVDSGIVSAAGEWLPLVSGKAENGLGKYHWDKVKRHARQCFMPGSNGRYLVEELQRLKQQSGMHIHTLSHSAGSLPVAELIRYLGQQQAGHLDQVVMLVPAVNQQVFAELVIPNRDVFSGMKVYALTEKAEKQDQVGHSVLYSASLLYAVSALAERGHYMDKMLLIDQHMDPARAPYRSGKYLCAACEKPEMVWDFFAGDTPQAEFITYPFAGGGTPSGAASHENTKYPWISGDLAQQIFSVFGVAGAGTLVFSPPEQ